MGSPGGGYDTYTRTVSAFLEKRIAARKSSSPTRWRRAA